MNVAERNKEKLKIKAAAGVKAPKAKAGSS
jgi:hypothetical protein